MIFSRPQLIVCAFRQRAGKKNNLFSKESEDITPPKRSRNDGNDGRSDGLEKTLKHLLVSGETANTTVIC